MASYFDDPGYDPRRGAVLGRVRKKDFSIDGKSWDYRDPYNQEMLRRQNRGGSVSEDERITVNEHSSSLFNPLYDYDYGTVRDAAKSLGIGNVDEKDEVDRIMNYIQGGGPEDDKEDEKEEETPPPTLDPRPNDERPESVQEDQKAFEESRLDKPENQMPRFADAFLGDGSQAANANASPTEAFDANMAAISAGDDLNEYYQSKFVPHLEAEANAGASEIGDSSRYFLDKFLFEPPKLGSVKDIFDVYKSEIEDLD